MRFQDAARDGRAIVYAGIQADPLVGKVASHLIDASAPELVLARAVMNGERTDPASWRAMFPTLFAPEAPEATETPALREHRSEERRVGKECRL